MGESIQKDKTKNHGPYRKKTKNPYEEKERDEDVVKMANIWGW